MSVLPKDEKDQRIAELEAALRPFVRLMDAMEPSYPQQDDYVVLRPPLAVRSDARVTIFDVKKARRALYGGHNRIAEFEKALWPFIEVAKAAMTYEYLPGYIPAHGRQMPSHVLWSVRLNRRQQVKVTFADVRRAKKALRVR
ncbi:MAG: hypothetical protein ACM31O_21045 [Bacteroidota bacterium]